MHPQSDSQSPLLIPPFSDTSLAALALEQGPTLCSPDRDFLRFPALKRFDPTQDSQTQPLPIQPTSRIQMDRRREEASDGPTAFTTAIEPLLR